MQGAADAADLRSCPRCGTTAEDILSTGFVGCEECYQHFGRTIVGLVEEIRKIG